MAPHPLPRAFALVLTSLVVSCAVLLAARAGDAASTSRVRFNRDVRPLLSGRCFACHGPGKQKAKLRLDQADGEQGAYRERGGARAIVPGSPEDSELWYRITTDDPLDAMPPADSHKERLDARERDLIRRWILEGAEYERHWAFVAPTAPAIPAVRDEKWSGQAIDRLVMHRLEAEGLQPQPRADRRTLIRRLTLDLTGMPPTREEIAAFLREESPEAYEQLVDRLLASPRYGEHMARYWLDLVRFADTNGIHHDHFRDLSPYRDWVIRSFNSNLGYDRFVTDQLAGDLFAEPTEDQRIASGFHRLHRIIDVGTALPEESFTLNVVDRVTSVGTAFLGLTLQCATCHNHKYDPVSQADFYAMFAFFNNLDAAPETGGRSGPDFLRGLQPPYIDLPTPEQAVALAELEAAPAEERDAFLVGVRGAMVMKERAEARPAFVLVRGDYQNPGAPVERATPAFLPPLQSENEVPTRLDLAHWLVAPAHPLTARVALNRFWQQLFGVGIVKTAEDFGTQGEWPTHPELLDYLAVSFVESGWDVKALIKQMVMAETYRQSSAAAPEAYARDPENRLLARGSRFRMDAEMIRDQILATSGRWNPAMYGRSVKPPQPPGIWAAVTLPDSYPRIHTPDAGEGIYRRSVYTFWKRGMPPPQMTILDAPTREYCTARRERTNTPLQALLSMNEVETLKAARHLAVATLGESQAADERLRILYETITSRLPDPVESGAWLELVRDVQTIYAQAPELAAQFCEDLPLDADGPAAPEVAAWTMLVSALYNLDITKTRE